MVGVKLTLPNKACDFYAWLDTRGAALAISKEVLTASISMLSDDELLKRWSSQEFIDDALPIAADEMRRRGLNATPEALVEVDLREKAQAKAIRSGYYAKIGRGCLYVVLAFVSVAVAAIAKMIFPMIFK